MCREESPSVCIPEYTTAIYVCLGCSTVHPTQNHHLSRNIVLRRLQLSPLELHDEKGIHVAAAGPPPRKSKTSHGAGVSSMRYSFRFCHAAPEESWRLIDADLHIFVCRMVGFTAVSGLLIQVRKDFGNGVPGDVKASRPDDPEQKKCPLT